MSPSTKYKVNELFRSLQGEGANTGLDTAFVRLCGCNLACPWCDTDHASGEDMTAGEIAGELRARFPDCGRVIVTGGEPTIRDLAPLLDALAGAGFWIALETNGTHDLAGWRDRINYVSCSPKSLETLRLAEADEARVVAAPGVDLETLRAVQARLAAAAYFLSPLHVEGVGFNILETITLLGQANAGAVVRAPWRLSIQAHKLAGIR